MFNSGDLIFVDQENIGKFNMLSFYVGKPFIYLRSCTTKIGENIPNMAEIIFPDGEVMHACINYFKKL